MTGTATILRADARALPLPDASVDLIITSPPYYKLRSYEDDGQHYPGQIGDEDTPQEYVANLLACTREWIRVLKPTGSMWVNLGDKFTNRTRGDWRGSSDGYTSRGASPRYVRPKDLAEKSLMGLPWRYAFRRMDELGLILRRDQIWHKATAMPESATDRTRTAHEYLFHFTVSPFYYAAVDLIRDPHRMRPQRRPRGHRTRQKLGVLPAQTYSTSQRDEVGVDGHPLGALPGSVWKLPGEPLRIPEHVAHASCCGGVSLPGCDRGLRHFAAFPTSLPRLIIQGWCPAGVCTACGEGRRPLVAAGEPESNFPSDVPTRRIPGTGRNPLSRHGEPGSTLRMNRAVVIVGEVCGCPDTSAPTRSAVVLDPLGGTGTSTLVAKALGRHGISVDRSADYCRLARWRTTDPGQLAKAMQMPAPAKQSNGQAALFDLIGGVS